MISEVRFGPWLPDGTDHMNPGLEECLNVIPGPTGYQPFHGPGAVVADAGAAVLSAKMFERADGTRVVVCATAGDLHVIVGGTVTNSALGLALTSPVAFERFGDEIYATNKSGTWRLADIDVSTTFVAAAWTIPDALALGRISEFLFAGNLTDTDASDAPYRIRWSPFNNPAGTWAGDVGTQSGAVNMPSKYGPVMAITGGTWGMIFQKYAISRISYTGGAQVFAKQIVDPDRGCAAPYSVAQVGDAVYFLSHDGFFVTNGGPSESVSRGRVWQWFLDNSSQVYLGSVSAAVDWPNRCVNWTVMGGTGQVTGILHFNWETGDWSHSEVALDCLLSAGVDGVTLESVAVTYPDLDAMPISLDSPEFSARGRILGAFVAGEYRLMNGQSLAASFGTGEFQIVPGLRTFVRAVTPIVTNDSENTTVSMGGRDRMTASLSYVPDVAIGPLGFCPFAFDARYYRVSVDIPANAPWRDAYGFHIDHDPSGEV